MRERFWCLCVVVLLSLSVRAAMAAEPVASGQRGDRGGVEVIKKAEALSVSGFVLGGLNFALTIPGWAMGQVGSELAVYMLPTFMSSAALVGAFSTALGKKSGLWEKYAKHGVIDALGWTFTGLSFAGFGVYLGALIGGNMICWHVGFYVGMFTASAALFMFAIKALKIKQMAIEGGKNRDAKRKVSMAPSVAPLFGADQAIHGGAIALSGAF